MENENGRLTDFEILQNFYGKVTGLGVIARNNPDSIAFCHEIGQAMYSHCIDFELVDDQIVFFDTMPGHDRTVLVHSLNNEDYENLKRVFVDRASLTIEIDAYEGTGFKIISTK